MKLIEEQTAEINRLLETITKNGEQTKLLIETIGELTDSKLQKDEELSDMKTKLAEMKKSHTKNSVDLEDAKSK